MTATAIISLVMTYLPMVITGAAAAAAALPQAKPNTVWSGARGVIDFLALNFGNAKNAPIK